MPLGKGILFVDFFMENQIEHSLLLLFVYQNNQLCPQSSWSDACWTYSSKSTKYYNDINEACFAPF